MSYHSQNAYTQKMKRYPRHKFFREIDLRRFRAGISYREYNPVLDRQGTGEVNTPKRINGDGEEKPFARLPVNGEHAHFYDKNNPRITHFFEVIGREVAGNG